MMFGKPVAALMALVLGILVATPARGSLVYREALSLQGTDRATANTDHQNQAPAEVEALLTQANTMEGELNTVKEEMASVRNRVRRLKSLTAGVAAMMTDASRVATVTSQTALTNRVYLNSIERNQKQMDKGMNLTGTAEKKIQKLLSKLEARDKSGAIKKSASAYEPNITALETIFKEMTSDKVKTSIDGLKGKFSVYEGNVTVMAKKAIQGNIRELVDVQREALSNYSLALAPPARDPCCPPC